MCSGYVSMTTKGRNKILTKIQWKHDRTTYFNSCCDDKFEFGKQLWITVFFLVLSGLLFAEDYSYSHTS